MSGAERLVLGTAGHIDHGKTALVRALTGVDTDRLPEERERGITLDLGFAPLDLPGGVRLSLVDVPGHEALVRNMVAGATGIDLVLLVVAADEGVMPQTREHLAICQLLGVTRGVVALSKTDAVDPDLAGLAAEEVRSELARGPLAALPVVPVSARSGAGLDELRAALAREAAAAPPHTPRRGPPRLAVDRVFSARGFGTVVTGTLVGGPLRVGDAVELLPGGPRGRVRGLQSFGVSAEELSPGLRCAVNLQGVEHTALARGLVLTHPGAVAPTRTLDAELHWLPSAPRGEGLVSGQLLAGTAERRVRVGAIGAPALEPGANGWARLHVDGPPLALLPGDRFVLRGFARTELGGATLGGGRVLDAAPPRRRRSDPQLATELGELAAGDPARGLAVRVARAGLAGADGARLARESGLSAAELDEALAQLERTGRARPAGAARWIAPEALAGLEAALESALLDWHAREPLAPGMPLASLRGTLPANVPAEVADCALSGLCERGAVVISGEHARAEAHRVALDPAQEELAGRLLASARAAGLEPPALREWCQQLGASAAELRPLLAHLEHRGELVRARGELWFHRTHVDALRDRVRAYLREHGSLATPAYKSLIGTTRRTAVPLMELFDDERVTVRRGELRRLRGASP